MNQQQLADDVTAGMAAIMVPLADSLPSRPVTAGPLDLPDLVHEMLLLARQTPGFTALAMLGAEGVDADQWRAVGALHLEIGRRCLAAASEMDSRTYPHGDV